MKSVVITENLDDQAISVRSKKHSSTSEKHGRPNPSNFEIFVPCLCQEWKCPQMVLVIRKQEQQSKRRSLQSQQSNHSRRSSSKNKSTGARRSTQSAESTKYLEDKNYVILNTIYNKKGQLTDISVSNEHGIHIKVIKAISICITHHSAVEKFCIRGGNLNCILMSELSKMVLHSHVIELCLDGCFIAEGNYYIFLDKITQLKYLSLKRCSINDLVCEKLAAKMAFGMPGAALLALDLGSNLITDVGAQSFANMLRQNRSLLHLDLSGNMITDEGALSIIKSLMLFPLTRKEILESKTRKLTFFENKIEVYNRCLVDVLERQSRKSFTRASTSKKSPKVKPLKKIKSIASPRLAPATEQAKFMVSKLLGEFLDPLSDDNIERINYITHCKGNLVLCSLNLAFNDLGYLSIKKLCEVLLYQQNVKKPPNARGLLKLNIDGNYVPAFCEEYNIIENVLKEKVNYYAPISVTKKDLSPNARNKTH